MDRTKQEFVIAKTSLSDDLKWRERRSGTSRYTHEDFGVKKSKSPTFLRLAILAFVGFFSILLAAFVMSVSLGDSIAIRKEYGTLTANDILVLFIIFCFVVWVIVSTKTIAASSNPKTDDLNLVIVTWEPFQFYVGGKGICLDGGIVNFYLEWDAIQYVNQFDSKLDFINPDGLLLTVPKRFFDADGGDLTWQEFLSYVRLKSRNADWLMV
jgi:hypothetical protein